MLKKCLLIIIRAYQLSLSSLIGRQCRFYPSCSVYASEAIETHGVKRGVTLAACRVGKCHPFHPGGYDPVPDTPES